MRRKNSLLLGIILLLSSCTFQGSFIRRDREGVAQCRWLGFGEYCSYQQSQRGYYHD